MAINSNSFASKAVAALSALHKAKDAVENRFGSFMQTVFEVMGDRDTMGGDIAPMAEWTASAERRKDVSDRVMYAIGFDEEWNASLKDASTSLKALEKARKQHAQRDVKRAVDCLAAMFVLGSKHDVFARFDDNMWRIPLVWLVKEGQDVMTPSKGPHKDGCTTFTDRNNKAYVVVQGEEGVETVGVSVTADVLITLSSIKPKVTKGADQVQQNAAAPDSIAAATDMLGVAISADDYKVAFTGDAADSMATLAAHMVRNDTLWALLIGEREQYEREVAQSAKAA